MAYTWKDVTYTETGYALPDGQEFESATDLGEYLEQELLGEDR